MRKCPCGTSRGKGLLHIYGCRCSAAPGIFPARPDNAICFGNTPGHACPVRCDFPDGNGAGGAVGQARFDCGCDSGRAVFYYKGRCIYTAAQILLYPFVPCGADPFYADCSGIFADKKLLYPLFGLPLAYHLLVDDTRRYFFADPPVPVREWMPELSVLCIMAALLCFAVSLETAKNDT